jgi:hypothetical protein
MIEFGVTAQDQLVVKGETIRKGFERFHAANPSVYKRLVAHARVWRHAQPGRKLGIGMLFERLRWDLALQTRGEPIKLNNNYRSYYARLIMAQEPDLADIFATRRLRAPDYPDQEGDSDGRD